MTDDIGCKSIMFRGSATGRVVTCGVCDWCRARRVTELEADVERLQAERDVAIDAMKGADLLIDEMEARVTQLEAALTEIKWLIDDPTIWSFSFVHQTSHRISDIIDAVLAPDTNTTEPTCKTCGGTHLVNAVRTEVDAYDGDPCPDCSPDTTEGGK